jgi:hypothetical protein
VSRPARTSGAVAAVAAAALLLSGCGSGDDGKADKGGGKSGASASSPEADPAATATAEESAKPEPQPTTGGKKTKAPKVAGIWKAKGKQVVLTIAGDRVTMLRQESNCAGRVVGAGKRTLQLKCPDGTSAARTKGEVAKVGAKSMQVRWNGGATDDYARVADAPEKLPESPGDVAKLPGS